MQDVLPLINLPDEALHEAYCVLKKGGRLVIVDEYHTPILTRSSSGALADRGSNGRARYRDKEGDCETEPVRFVDFRFDGARSSSKDR